MKLYYCKSFKNRKDSHKLLQIAIEDYMSSISNKTVANNDQVPSEGVLPKGLTILTTKEGKPYLDIPGVHFNISHSKGLWICGVSTEPVGVDVEMIRKRSYDRLMEKYFSFDEIKYVEENGEDSFFQIWTFKEAHSKLLGESIFHNLRVNAVEDGKIKEEYMDAKYMMFSEFDGAKCTLAKKNEIIKLELKEITI